jgi:hypothetical protein
MNHTKANKNTTTCKQKNLSFSPFEKSQNEGTAVSLSIGSQSVYFNSQVKSQAYSFDEESLSLSNEEFLLNDNIKLIRRNNNNNNNNNNSNVTSPHLISNTIAYSSTQESIIPSQSPISQSPISQIQTRNLAQSDFYLSTSNPQQYITPSNPLYIDKNDMDDIDEEIFDIFQENGQFKC